MPAGEGDLTELFIRSFKCTGDVPPALVGSSVTYLDGYAYVFGGRALHSGKLSNDMYACDLRTYNWRRIDVGTAEMQPELQCVDAPSPRFFHSCTAFKHYMVVFGGMGLDTDTDAAEAPVERTTIQDDRNQQSFQVRSSKTLLGDIAVFDTRVERWVGRRALDSKADADKGDADKGMQADEAQTDTPSARYAHLSTLLGSRLLVVGGQDLEEQYVEELNVFDLQLGRWVLRSPFPRAVGLYRSFIASVQSGSTLLYSNYSFASVKRALYRLSAPPDCTLQEVSDQLDGSPPGLRFPRGHRIDPRTLLMSGTLISTEGHSELSLWTLDATSLRWQPVRCGAKFRAGSWNQSVVDPRSNTLVLFGDSRRDLTYDYQRRRLNYAEIRVVDLRALGYLRASRAPELPLSIASGPLAAARTAATGTLTQQGAKSASETLGFEVGAQLLHFPLFSDAEVATLDGSCVAVVNSGLLRKRWPNQAQLWMDASRSPSRRGSQTEGLVRPSSNRTGRPESSLLSGNYEETEPVTVEPSSNGARRFVIDGSREAIFVLVFYLYTGVIDPHARFGLHQGAEAAAQDELGVVRVLGDLLVIARKYDIDTLALQIVNMLRWHVSVVSAPLIYDAALRADHHGLQARAVIAVQDHISSLRADHQSTLYAISSTARANILRFFPKLATEEPPKLEADHLQYTNQVPQGSAYSSNSVTPDMRQRSPSDALMGDMSSARNNASGSPASTLRGNPARSPYQQDLANPRRPWEATMMASPVINSPASGRFSSQSPDTRTAYDNKRMSGISHVASQPLPEDIALNYGSLPNSASSDTMPMSQSQSSNSSKRVSRYLGNITGGIASVESVHDRRTSDASGNESMLQPPQQQQSRSFFRPWSKVKKLTSSNQISTDSLPPIPSHASTYSAHSAQ
ncbi:hypothetical protein GGH96_002740 [Coemansia sp. RSA 1972]|nr:hypothetical protein GGH96_002740 [Coemansia sp. RSA 1972]